MAENRVLLLRTCQKLNSRCTQKVRVMIQNPVRYLAPVTFNLNWYSRMSISLLGYFKSAPRYLIYAANTPVRETAENGS
jgi:hypothetical protein